MASAPTAAVQHATNHPKKHHRSAHHHAREYTLRKHVHRPGIYRVSVVVTSHTGRRAAVRLEIGKHTRDAKTDKSKRTTVVRADVTVHGDVVTIHGVPLRGHVTVRVRLRRIAGLPKPKPAPGPGLTSGSTGSSGTTSGTTSAGTPVPTGVPGTWNLIFNDDFTESSLNTSLWSTGWFGSGITVGVGGASEPECYDPSHVVVGGGELDINFTQETETCGGSSHAYTTGIVTTNGKFSFTYGLVEFRAWLPTTSSGQVADWPDLWLDGQTWPADGEIDDAEGLGGSLCAHYHGPTDGGNGAGAGGGTGCPAGTFTGGWHTFSADWEPGIVTYYYDGKDIGCLETSGTACGPNNQTIAGAPMYIILSLGSNPDYTITAPTSLRVAYVRVWQH
jgi:beta-glucanase (GH16 family)